MVLPLVLPVEPVEPVPYGLVLEPDGALLLVSVPVPVPVVPEGLEPVELLPEYGEVLDPLVPAPPPVLVLGAELVLSDPLPTPPADDELPVEPIPDELPVEPIPVELLPVLVSLLLPVLVSLLLPVPPTVDELPVEVLPVVSELVPVPPIVEVPLVPAPVLVLGADGVLSELPAEPVPMELGSLVVVELEEPPLP